MSMARRETLSCSRPEASMSESSVIAGTWRSRRKASSRRCWMSHGFHAICVVQPIWPSISVTKWLILAAAAAACSA